MYNSADKTSKTTMQWEVPVKAASYSNTAELILGPAPAELELSSLEIMTLRIEK